jgi:phosphate transport system protein
MGLGSHDTSERLGAIRARLADQGHLVTRIAESAFESVYTRDTALAHELIERDDEVDREDVQIERDTVELMCAAASGTGSLSPEQVRSALTIVKVNNEIERVADAATNIASRVIALGDRASAFPKTTQVMTNSVIGILRDTVTSFSGSDPQLARLVLSAEGAVLEFHTIIVRKSEERIADGRMSVDHAFELSAITHQAVLMADHCTNIAEQVIYESTGAIVRHTDAGWVDQELKGL